MQLVDQELLFTASGLVKFLACRPELMTIECRTVEQMRLVNALRLLDEYAANAAGEPAAGGSLS